MSSSTKKNGDSSKKLTIYGRPHFYTLYYCDFKSHNVPIIHSVMNPVSGLRTEYHGTQTFISLDAIYQFLRLTVVHPVAIGVYPHRATSEVLIWSIDDNCWSDLRLTYQ